MHEMHVHTHSQWSLPVAGWPAAVFTSTVNSYHGCDIWSTYLSTGRGGGTCIAYHNGPPKPLLAPDKNCDSPVVVVGQERGVAGTIRFILVNLISSSEVVIVGLGMWFASTVVTELSWAEGVWLLLAWCWFAVMVQPQYCTECGTHHSLEGSH